MSMGLSEGAVFFMHERRRKMKTRIQAPCGQPEKKETKKASSGAWKAGREKGGISYGFFH